MILQRVLEPLDWWEASFVYISVTSLFAICTTLVDTKGETTSKYFFLSLVLFEEKKKERKKMPPS